MLTHETVCKSSFSFITISVIVIFIVHVSVIVSVIVSITSITSISLERGARSYPELLNVSVKSKLE